MLSRVPLSTGLGGRVAVLAAVAAALLFVPITPVVAQTCTPEWDLDIGQPGTGHRVTSIVEYNGEVYAAGWFTDIGPQTVNHIARWDGTTWHPLTAGGQTGVDGFVRSMAVYDGELVVGGSFREAGGQTVNRIARWDGSNWHPLVSGNQVGVDVNGGVDAMAEYNGDLYVGGSFATAGGHVVNRIARWDGSMWHQIEAPSGHIGVSHAAGGGFGGVFALMEHGGELIVGGTFEEAGGQTVNNIARWDGTNWNRFEIGGVVGTRSGASVAQGPVRSLGEYSGDLVIGGMFDDIAGQHANRIARWDGNAWHAFISGGQNGTNGDVSVIIEYLGDLFVGGGMTLAGGHSVHRIARWDGSEWHQITSGGQTGVTGWAVYAFLEHNNELIVGGQFTAAGGQSVGHIATWVGCVPPPSCWDNAHGRPGMGGPVNALAEYGGELYAGGRFGQAGHSLAGNVARWDGAAWRPLISGGQNGVGGTGRAWVSAMTEFDGGLIVGGRFEAAGGQTVNNIARWDGSDWHPLISGGQVGVDGDVAALVEHNGDLIVGGFFTAAGGQAVNYIARWDGSGWHPMVNVNGEIGMSNAVSALAEHGGDLIAGGAFTEAGGVTTNHIARWDGSNWHAFSTGFDARVHAIAEYNGDLVVGGLFANAGAVPMNSVAIWAGRSWRQLRDSTGSVGVGGSVDALAEHDGELFAGGTFTMAGGQAASYIARWDNSDWLPLDEGVEGPAAPSVNALLEHDDELIVGGFFIWAGMLPSGNIAFWGDCDPCHADWNGDGHVDINDFFAFLNDFAAGAPRADLNGDGSVDILDYFLFLDYYNQGC